MSSWIQHVKTYAAEHGISFKDALSKAKGSYTTAQASLRSLGERCTGALSSKPAKALPKVTKESNDSSPSLSPSTSAPHLSWIQHVKSYAAEHGISYKDALSKAKDSYVKKSKDRASFAIIRQGSDAGQSLTQAGAIKVYDKSTSNKKNVVKASESNLKKTTLSAKEGRAFILKILPEKVISTKAAIKFLSKFDNNASFRNTLLHMSPNEFKETILIEMYKHLSGTIDELDERQENIERRRGQLFKKQRNGILTESEKRQLNEAGETLNDIKKKKDEIAKATAALVAVDTSTGADELNDKIQRPRHKPLTSSQISDMAEFSKLNKYYTNLPKYILRSKDLDAQDSVVDIVNNALLMQTRFPSKFKVTDVDRDPLIEYLDRLITTRGPYIPERKAVYKDGGLHTYITRKRDENLAALEDYKKRVGVSKHHNFGLLKSLLLRFKQNMSDSQFFNVDEIRRNLTNPETTDQDVDKLYSDLLNRTASDGRVNYQIMKYNNLAEQSGDEIGDWENISDNEDEYEDQDEDEDNDSDQEQEQDEDKKKRDEDEREKVGHTVRTKKWKDLLNTSLANEKAAEKAEKEAKEKAIKEKATKEKAEAKRKAAIAKSIEEEKARIKQRAVEEEADRIRWAAEEAARSKRATKTNVPRSSTPQPAPSASAFRLKYTPADDADQDPRFQHDSPWKKSVQRFFLNDDDDDEEGTGILKRSKPTFKFLKNKQPKAGSKKVKMTIYRK